MVGTTGPRQHSDSKKDLPIVPEAGESATPSLRVTRHSKGKPSQSRYLEQKGNQRIIVRHEAITRELATTRQKLATTPETVAASTLDDREMATMRFERRQTMMSLRIAACHAHCRLRPPIAKHHSDYREMGKVLRRLVHGGGTYTTGATEKHG